MTVGAPLSPIANSDSGESHANVGRLFALLSPIMPAESENHDEDMSSNLSIPRVLVGQGEEELKEYDVSTGDKSMLPLSLANAPDLTRQDHSVLSTNFDLIDDDSTDGNVCAICLDGYGEFERM